MVWSLRTDRPLISPAGDLGGEAPGAARGDAPSLESPCIFQDTASALGAPPTVPAANPNSRWGRAASPHAQGRVMEPIFVGIDVAKDRLDVHVQPSGEAFSVRRDDAGLTDLVRRLHPLAPTLVALEATGGYGVVVAATLAAAGLSVAVINPRQIRDFARAPMQEFQRSGELSARRGSGAHAAPPLTSCLGLAARRGPTASDRHTALPDQRESHP